jgi:hypothetical protein
MQALLVAGADEDACTADSITAQNSSNESHL